MICRLAKATRKYPQPILGCVTRASSSCCNAAHFRTAFSRIESSLGTTRLPGLFFERTKVEGRARFHNGWQHQIVLPEVLGCRFSLELVFGGRKEIHEDLSRRNR